MSVTVTVDMEVTRAVCVVVVAVAVGVGSVVESSEPSSQESSELEEVEFEEEPCWAKIPPFAPVASMTERACRSLVHWTVTFPCSLTEGRAKQLVEKEHCFVTFHSLDEEQDAMFPLTQAIVSVVASQVSPSLSD